MNTFTHRWLYSTVFAVLSCSASMVMADSKWDRFDTGAGSEQKPPQAEQSSPPSQRGQGAIVNSNKWDNYDRGRSDNPPPARQDWNNRYDERDKDRNRDWHHRDDWNNENDNSRMRRYYPDYENRNRDYNQNYNSSDNRITCSSFNGAYTYCNADVRGKVQLYRQLSNANCRYNDSWGYDSGGIWVNDGCRAEFSIENNNNNRNRDRNSGNNSTQSVICSSQDNNYTFCEMNTRRGVKLYRQLSNATCKFGETWGYDKRGIWVDAGCRGEFVTSNR
ncbi:Protein of unknown function (DUF3011) [Beggiatoa alba B18LD]|uniref:DUF3011 domain-containing protein n=1 Tax=Beggiatoa alba B18LD TaxID=395493 RepID=I3CCG1_9GAMM|nr:DUF3011 domain-containing protein [Beggiatoa alba]EIJ41304.1 Protein of unknown function (DUF3011) [Beggiatoa alba B18LD]